MRSASRQALETLREAQHSAVGPKSDAATFTTLAQELYSLAELLVAQPRLRRTLGDPATQPEARAGLFERLVSGKLGDGATEVGKAAVSQRWSSPWDLTDALESAADDAMFSAAERDNELDRVEDELFRLERILQDDGELTGLLDESAHRRPATPHRPARRPAGRQGQRHDARAAAPRRRQPAQAQPSCWPSTTCSTRRLRGGNVPSPASCPPHRSAQPSRIVWPRR